MRAFTLRFPAASIPHYADRYEYAGEKDVLETGKAAGRLGQLSKAKLRQICKWKAQRSAGRMESNPEAYVEEITRFALSVKNERARIESLTLLDGVAWPTASVILHLCHTDPYPIIDFRALWSLSVDVPAQYTFDFWWPYVKFCRSLAERCGVDMRTLDRALWQYSKESQEARNT